MVVLCHQRTLDWISRILAVFAFVAGLRYVIWRWTRVVDTSYWLSLPFVICEGCLILLGSGAFYLQISFYQRRKNTRLNDLGINRDRWPKVDVMIPCFREPVEVIERTVRAALEIDWPADKLTVLLLDDGGSQEVYNTIQALSLQLLKEKEQKPSLRYIARLRKPNEPHHAKAGNLNNAIFKSATSGDYILVLDCDMAAKPEILQVLMPHFFDIHRALDDHIAMVQSPQSFSNVAPGDPMNNRSPLFYHVLLPGWDGLNATPCCGTNVVFARKALNTISGFTYGSVTEDFLTSLTLNTAGYRTRYVDEVLAVGLAPEGLDSFFAQRLRWAVGGLQIFRYFNPLFKVGLTWPQRLLYAWSAGHYLLSFALAIVLCTPFLFLLDDGRLLLTTGTVREYLLHFFPYYILHTMVIALSHRRLGWQGFRYFWRAQQEPIYMLFNNIRACMIVGLGLQFGFRVTPKDGKKDDSIFLKDLTNALPHVIFFMVGLACFVTGTLQMAELHMKTDLWVAYIINMFWAALVLCGLWVPIGQFLEIGVPCQSTTSCWPFNKASQEADYEPIQEEDHQAKTVEEGNATPLSSSPIKTKMTVQRAEATAANDLQVDKLKPAAPVASPSASEKMPLLRTPAGQ